MYRFTEDTRSKEFIIRSVKEEVQGAVVRNEWLLHAVQAIRYMHRGLYMSIAYVHAHICTHARTHT